MHRIPLIRFKSTKIVKAGRETYEKRPRRLPGDVNFKVACDLSNLPAMYSNAFKSSWQDIELCTDVISNTGACPRPTGGSTATATRPRKA